MAKKVAGESANGTRMIRIDGEILHLVREQAKKHDRSIRSMLAILVKAALSQGGNQ